MKNHPTISQLLLELSDALEQIALALAKQKARDLEVPVHKLAVVQNKILRLTDKQKVQRDNYRKLIKQKYHKGFLKKWLSGKNIFIGNHIDNLLVNKNLYQVAEYLTDHYFELKDFYKQLKYHQNIRKDFVLKNTNKYSKDYIRKWAKMLLNNKLIDAFSFLDHGNKVDIDIAEIHRATLFINGQWLEIFLRSELAKYLKQNLNSIESFDILAQVEIVKPDSKTSELDLLLMLNDRVYWFEAKSGHINRYYKVFKQHRRLLQLPKERSFLLVPVMLQNQAEAVDHNSGMTLFYADQLDLQFSKILFNNTTFIP